MNTNTNTNEAESSLVDTVLDRIEKPKVYGMGVGSICSNRSFTFEDTSVIELADRLEAEPDVLAIGVIDRRGKVSGIVTRKELFGLLGRPFGREILKRKRVSALVMDIRKFHINQNIFTVSEEIEDQINSNETHFFLLTNDRDEFCGLFSGKDMLVFLAEITRRDISLSRKIQTRIVKEKDDYSGTAFSLSASSVMAKGIGGDFYSYKEVSDSIYMIAICDVSGKGMAASLLSSQLSGFINTYPLGNDLEDLIQDLNAQLVRSFEGEKFVTGIFCILNEITGQLQIADMGHTHYLHFRKGAHMVHSQSNSNLPLGISNEMTVNTFTINLKQGDCFFIFTDGLIEQKNHEERMYGRERVERLLRTHSEDAAGKLREMLLEDFDAFRGTASRQDDITFIFLTFTPAGGSGKTTESNGYVGIEEKIKWALATGKPIQIKTIRYRPEDREFIDSVLDRFLNKAGIRFLMNKISYCVHELATNAKKANTKRVYFRRKRLNIEDSEQYRRGMEKFKLDTLDNIDFYLDLQKKLGYFIVVVFRLTRKHLRVSVVNNTEMTSEEKAKIAHKLRIAAKQNAISDIYDQIEDYSEGAGLGIVMMTQMLKNMGFGPDALTIHSEQGLTTASISIRLRE